MLTRQSGRRTRHLRLALALHVVPELRARLVVDVPILIHILILLLALLLLDTWCSVDNYFLEPKIRYFSTYKVKICLYP